MELQEVKQSYYEYVVNVNKGALFIAEALRNGDNVGALQSIADFSEGIEWLLNIENFMMTHSYTINSTINEAKAFFQEINDCLEFQDFTNLADLFEYEIAPLFSSAVEWTFKIKE